VFFIKTLSLALLFPRKLPIFKSTLFSRPKQIGPATFRHFAAAARGESIYRGCFRLLRTVPAEKGAQALALPFFISPKINLQSGPFPQWSLPLYVSASSLFIPKSFDALLLNNDKRASVKAQRN
jgi:hypothetical protein